MRQLVLPVDSCLGPMTAPNHQRWYAKGKLSWNIHALRTRFCSFGADLYAQSVLSDKILAVELSRKIIKSALLVGQGTKGERGGGGNFTRSWSRQ